MYLVIHDFEVNADTLVFTRSTARRRAVDLGQTDNGPYEKAIGYLENLDSQIADRVMNGVDERRTGLLNREVLFSPSTRFLSAPVCCLS